MNHLFKTTLERFSEILLKNARPIMHRLIVGMKTEMESQPQQSVPFDSILILKTSENSLIEEFYQALQNSIGSSASVTHVVASAMSFSLAPADESESKTPDNDFVGSDLIFEQLCQKAEIFQINSFRNYNKELFLNCISSAFKKLRLESVESDKLMPYARRALNTELSHLYSKLDALQSH